MRLRQLVNMPGAELVIDPETVREFTPLMVMPVRAPSAFGAFIVIDAQLAAVSIVTVLPELIVTVSPATGTEAPPHVAVLLQLPDTLALLAAAQTDDGQISKAIMGTSPLAVLRKDPVREPAG